MSRGPYVQLYTGTCWYFCAPRPEDVRFADLQGLTTLNRYCGAARPAISVAEHCVRVARLLRLWGCDDDVCLAGGIHDPEHIPPGDLPGPFVRALEKDEAERRKDDPSYVDPTLHVRRIGERAVWTALDVIHVFEDPARAVPIWKADRVLLATERRDLVAPSDVDWGPLPEPLPERVVPWTPDQAWDEFQAMWTEFGGRRP